MDRLEWIGANDVVARGPSSGVISHLAAMMGLISMLVLWQPVNHCRGIRLICAINVVFVWRLMILNAIKGI